MRTFCFVLTFCLLGCNAPPDDFVFSEVGRSISETVNDIQDQINQGIPSNPIGGSLRGALDAVENEFNE